MIIWSDHVDWIDIKKEEWKRKEESFANNTWKMFFSQGGEKLLELGGHGFVIYYAKIMKM